MILFKDISKTYKINSHEVTPLQNINLKIDNGEFVIVAGPSGAGKTSLLRLLTCEDRPSTGEIYLDTLKINDLKNSELPFLRRKIGSIFQDFKLLPRKTVYENVAFALEVIGKNNKEIKETVLEVLELVGLEKLIYNFPHEISGGEMQRTAIARAIISKPDILTADEPTGNLDPLVSWEIVNLLTKINELGTTVILSSHNKEMIDALKKRVVTLKNGKIIRDEQKGKFIF
ncbi:ATP-binding cassette domain-containing protein [Candidatus Azambacteria bacterium]|nr:ATP-binding cassette domain-containing protein [Candidatus Azambacteria bacterium]